ncbi:type I restriction endonuclease subunit R [Beggiatoa leptomitoformis]|uniref:Type I restriction enzyme endonuclease subunit n=1 Tax=Beggiatoa leptomitoformis TaxID=288004 RepID=A0A2N9YIG0_9GAMM|nr:type I restriction endonuclease subunit R [Beggiatoa leptomitoformis]ALG67483.1 HsdR family type I site-specific deoxyribonuclease [Beggiatoa leptomitoformis]AUI70297.1 HsdR family type I site-specific deoxyribonuclease [Beggiatoa leptomitoformis]
MRNNDYSENTLIEQPAIQIFQQLGWKTANLFKEDPNNPKERKHQREVILTPRLRASLQKLNPNLPDIAYTQAIEELTRDRSLMIPINANQNFYECLKNGVKVSFKNPQGQDTHETLKIIDWNNPRNNDFFLVSQLWIKGELYTRRPDLIGFINGLPLLFIELKSVTQPLENAYKDNLRDYKTAIPQLFIPNAIILLSNGSQTRIGTLSASWEQFFNWEKISEAPSPYKTSLETALHGICTPENILDIIENFTVFETGHNGLIKKIAKNHQYLGVNEAVQAVANSEDNQGKLGVFWHTQGSGKSLSMVFFTQKVLRKLKGNWTFLIITDRQELDEQIYKTFVHTNAITKEAKTQANSGEHLKQLLQEDHRYIFSLIQKFRTETGATYPKLSDRHDIIVITDEAHRSQYDTLALNMRNALPNAAFIGFTGTPLIQDEEQRTREVFGDYVSIYNFRQSIHDKATVPLYYENRIPELQLSNENFNAEIENILEAAILDENQEKCLEKELSQTYHLITRDARLEVIAKDVVEHFCGRGYQGKAMMICIDKATAVKMYDKVQKYWQQRLKTADKQQTAEMQTVEMAVIVSQSQSEIEELKQKGVDIIPHRKRMTTENLDERFKNPADNLRFVFVCAMWITGFDVPSCSTIYLDKPMRNHTLMQTIARANRVTQGKVAGLIVDYVGVFKNLQQALAIYAAPSADMINGFIDNPIEDKQALVTELQSLLTDAKNFCQTRGVNIQAIQQAQRLDKVRLIDDAVECLLKNEEEKKLFILKTQEISRIFKAILPDKLASAIQPDTSVLVVLAQKIQSLTPSISVDGVLQEINHLLDKSVRVEEYQIKPEKNLLNLSELDFDALAQQFKSSPHQRTNIESLRTQLQQKLTTLLNQNHARRDYQTHFERLIDDYNAGSQNLTQFFELLLTFAKTLSEEEKRHIREGLTEEELALFDILQEPNLTPQEQAQIKKGAKALLARLKREKLILDWQTKQSVRAEIKVTIEEVLDNYLPEPTYTRALFRTKCEQTYQHVYSVW